MPLLPARVGAPACGDVMKLQVQLNDSGVVEDVKFMTFGCGSAIASSSYATEWLHGKSIDQALALKVRFHVHFSTSCLLILYMVRS